MPHTPLTHAYTYKSTWSGLVQGAQLLPSVVLRNKPQEISQPQHGVSPFIEFNINHVIHTCSYYAALPACCGASAGRCCDGKRHTQALCRRQYREQLEVLLHCPDGVHHTSCKHDHACCDLTCVAYWARATPTAPAPGAAELRGPACRGLPQAAGATVHAWPPHA